jgi:hypothetical protein
MEEDAMDEAQEHPICCCGGCSQFLIIPFLGLPSSHWLNISFFVGPNCVKHTEHEKGVSIDTKFISPKYGCEAHIPLAWQ